MPVCLCQRFFNREPEQCWLPEWGYNNKRKLLVLYCPDCKFDVGPFENKAAAIASWCFLNRPGDEQILNNWGRFYQKMFPDVKPPRDEIYDYY